MLRVTYDHTDLSDERKGHPGHFAATLPTGFTPLASGASRTDTSFRAGLPRIAYDRVLKATRVIIEHFRGIKSACLHLPDHAVLIGDNNTGKSTVLEALNLVLGPDRLNRRPPIDEHDFFMGRYRMPPVPAVSGIANLNIDGSGVGENTDAPARNAPNELDDGEAERAQIKIEVTVTHLSNEQQRHFWDWVEWWNELEQSFYEKAGPQGVDHPDIVAALRITFVGRYNSEEDDFEGDTYFSRSLEEGGEPQSFRKRDKQRCGFLYLRGLRTGSRALSLERGSLLDIILRLKELRPQMWEDTIAELADVDVASRPELGISGVLESINTALKRYVPHEWGVQPHLRVSNLTRDHLRKVITAFIATGQRDHAAPYYRQGTGTINMLVLAMLSQIAADKQNVIFAMEEPETAIPPYAQKRIVHELRNLSSQSILTSHSPYVLEEFDLEDTVILSRNATGEVDQATIELPSSVKLKRYRQEFRTRFCEGLLGRRVLLAEGATEAHAFPVAIRKLAELVPDEFTSLEALGVTVIDAGGERNIRDLGALYRGIGKTVFALCDKQEAATKTAIESKVDELFMHGKSGFESLVLQGTTRAALERFVATINWPPHLKGRFPEPENDPEAASAAYFEWSKGTGGLADFLAQCQLDEIPEWIKDVGRRLRAGCDPGSIDDPTEAGQRDHDSLVEAGDD